MGNRIQGLEGLAKIIKTGYMQWELASRQGPFQRLDARLKVISLIYFLIIVSLKRDIHAEAIILAFILLMTIMSGVSLSLIWRKVIALGFIFGFLIAFPASLNIITPGEVVLPLIELSKPYDFWIYHIPSGIGLTKEGLSGVLLLTLRVMNSLGLCLIVLYTTPFHEIIRALKALKVPDAFLIIITLSYKYIFIFARTVEDTYLARKARLVRGVSPSKTRQWIAGRIAFLFKKTQLRCEEVFKAMQARGLSDTVRLSGHKGLSRLDRSVGLCLCLFGILLLWI